MEGIILQTLADLYKKQEEIIRRLDDFNEPKKQMLYRVEDLIEILQVSRRTISTWTKEGRLSHTKLGNKIWVSEPQLNAFLENHSNNLLNQ